MSDIHVFHTHPLQCQHTETLGVWLVITLKAKNITPELNTQKYNIA